MELYLSAIDTESIFENGLILMRGKVYMLTNLSVCRLKPRSLVLVGRAKDLEIPLKLRLIFRQRRLCIIRLESI